MTRRLAKRKAKPREEYTIREQNKVDSGIFDTKTMVFLSKFFNKGVVATLGHIIARGKEADLYLADAGGSDAVRGGKYVVLKFFRIETSSFYRMGEYMLGDPRFSRISRKKYGIVMEWCKKEFGNLLLAEKAGVRAPRPFMFNGSVLAMSFISDGGTDPAPTLRETDLADPQATLDSILGEVRKMYRGKMVHADLSEYNILVSDGVPYLIDFGQAVMVQHPKAQEFLGRDVRNLLQYFRKRYGLDTDYDRAMRYITG